MKRAHRFALLFALALLPAAAQSQSAWHGARDGVTVKATALTRPAVLAFYQARGFSAEAIAPYAAACVFSFEVQNTTNKTARLRLADWRAAASIRFRPAESWEAEWASRGVAEPARIAFRWAQFQSELEFAPGDWIMGMAALERRPEGPFRLSIPYTIDKRRHEITLERIACSAAD
jgi:hypothetical protein